ncbi:Galactokinase [hydrothermal vent metagenome]|uniref:Galactokinase n=1 Tax=hydrothermal vent metagenome TaxID=652676 RepID=A0A3B1CFS2_9ZZZZ
MNKVEIKEIFKKNFNNQPIIIRAPGRINLIGEHTDYNDGYVLPASIDKAIYIAIANTNDVNSKIIAADLDDSIEFDLEQLDRSEKQWSNYIFGVIDQLRKAGYSSKNFNAVFGGDIPIGAGLSSSAALESGFAYAFKQLNKLSIDDLEIVKLSQKAEHEFVGVMCGIMDQFASVIGVKGKVIQLDCRSLDYKYFPFDYEDISIVLFDTGVSHSLASSEYNTRRSQCEEGVSIIQKHENNVNSLRDVDKQMLQKYKSEFDSVIYKRCEYVVEENSRVLLACEKLSEHDLDSFGRLMYETHEGLKNKYEVSCDELDYLVDQTLNIPGVLGARMMGGGFGGCTINLIRNEYLEETISTMSEVYENKFGRKLKSYITKIEDGTGELTDHN